VNSGGIGGQEPGAATSVLEQVRKLIERLGPAPICDGCIAETLRLSAPQRANPLARQLAGLGRFERRRDICSICYTEKLVTRHIRP